MTQAWADTVDEAAGNLNFQGMPDPEPVPDELNGAFTPEEPLDFDGAAPDIEPDLLNPKHSRPRGAVGYEKKANDLLQFAIALTAGRSATVADSAALILHGKKVSYALGDAAAEDPRIAAAIDFMSGGTSNPYIALATAVMPLMAQLARNHEPLLEPAPRKIRIPFTKRGFNLPIKFGIRLGFLKAMTDDPQDVYNYIYNQPQIVDKLTKLGVNVAPYRASRVKSSKQER